jgi:hypothetical protein
MEGLPKCSCEDCGGKRSHPKKDYLWAKYDFIDAVVTNTLGSIDGAIKEPDRHCYLLCTRRLFGFVLKSRTWGAFYPVLLIIPQETAMLKANLIGNSEMFDVACCHNPKIDKMAIDTLVMPEERKTMIKALVHRYTDPMVTGDKGHSPWRADFIQNKGEGQIFLLHGSPGVGKTYVSLALLP